MLGSTIALEPFAPAEPVSLREAGLTDSEVEALILKFLAARGDASGWAISDQVKLPYPLVAECLTRLKDTRLVAYRGSSGANDFLYQITDHGRDSARRLAHRCTYFGAAPVGLEDYIDSVVAQGITDRTPTEADLEAAFAGLLLDRAILDRLGPAINSGRGMFLYGSPGNGKTSIAERITRCFGSYIWIPRAIGVDGEIVRLFDPEIHEEVATDGRAGVLGSRRWTRAGCASSGRPSSSAASSPWTSSRCAPTRTRASARRRCSSRATAARW